MNLIEASQIPRVSMLISPTRIMTGLATKLAKSPDTELVKKKTPVIKKNCVNTCYHKAFKSHYQYEIIRRLTKSQEKLLKISKI